MDCLVLPVCLLRKRSMRSQLCYRSLKSEEEDAQVNEDTNSIFGVHQWVYKKLGLHTHIGSVDSGDWWQLANAVTYCKNEWKRLHSN
ncbi:hypothetical protein V6N13_102309 [Hibiscus sabdariffa]